MSNITSDLQVPPTLMKKDFIEYVQQRAGILGIVLEFCLSYPQMFKTQFLLATYPSYSHIINSFSSFSGLCNTIIIYQLFSLKIYAFC